MRKSVLNTTYIQSIIEIAMEKGIKLSNDDLNMLSLATSASMIFQKEESYTTN